ncbi:MAG: hypothetical protein WBO70_02665 [Erysipelotrichaceae bacterium]
MQKTKYLIIIGTILILIFATGGYYIWCTNNPNIYIKIGEGSSGKEGIKVQTPHIAIVDRHGIAPAKSIENNLDQIVKSHEDICEYLRDNFLTADIKLDIEIKSNETILKYHGIAKKMGGIEEEYKKEVIYDFVLNGDVKK